MSKKENFKVVIAGSRGFSNYALLRENCNKFLREKRKNYNIVIISGHARGADLLGERYSKDEGFDLEIYPADWKKKMGNQQVLGEMNKWQKLLMH